MGQFAAQRVWPAAGLVACVVAFFARPADSVGAGFVPGHLLLLPGRLLQGVFPRPAFLLRFRIKKRYSGEQSFPLFLQNVHRYFVFIALGFLVILTYDVWKGMWFTDPVTNKETFGIGVGTIVMAVNVFLLGSYATGCHSLRHVVGGMLDQLSRRPARFLAYRCVTCFNKKHMMWAWLSLFSVAFTDIYIRLCSMGVWTDFRII